VSCENLVHIQYEVWLLKNEAVHAAPGFDIMLITVQPSPSHVLNHVLLH